IYKYYYVMHDINLDDLRVWQPKVLDALKALPELVDIDSKEGRGAQQVTLEVDRATAARLGVDMAMVTSLLNNAFSQRQVSTIYESLNQYSVVLEIDPKFVGSPQVLEQMQVIGAKIGRAHV